MKSTPGSDRATPLHGHVKFVPSRRNWFSLVPEPNTDTLVVDPLPLGRRRRDTPGAALMKSNMLARRVGIASRSAGPNRVPNRGSVRRCASPLPPRRRIQRCRRASARPFLDGGAGPDADVLFMHVAKPGIVTSSTYIPEEETGSASVLSRSSSGSPVPRSAPASRDDDCTGKNAALVVLDRSDESSRQALGGSDAMQEHKSNKHQQAGSLPPTRKLFVHLDVHLRVLPADRRLRGTVTASCPLIANSTSQGGNVTSEARIGYEKEHDGQIKRSGSRRMTSQLLTNEGAGNWRLGYRLRLAKLEAIS